MTNITNTDTTATPLPTPGPAALIASFSRPADTTAYSLADVFSDSSSTARVICFAGAGRRGLVYNAGLVYAETDTVDFDLLLFDSAPANQTDNATLALAAGDSAKLIGVFRFTTGAKVNIGTNVEAYRAIDITTAQPAAPFAYVSADGNLYGIIVVRTVYTPISAAKMIARLHVVRE